MVVVTPRLPLPIPSPLNRNSEMHRRCLHHKPQALIGSRAPVHLAINPEHPQVNRMPVPIRTNKMPAMEGVRLPVLDQHLLDLRRPHPAPHSKILHRDLYRPLHDFHKVRMHPDEALPRPLAKRKCAHQPMVPDELPNSKQAYFNSAAVNATATSA